MKKEIRSKKGKVKKSKKICMGCSQPVSKNFFKSRERDDDGEFIYMCDKCLGRDKLSAKIGKKLIQQFSLKGLPIKE